MSVNYQLRTTKKNGCKSATIWVRVRCGKKDILISTRKSVIIGDWDRENGCIKDRRRQKLVELRDFQYKLDSLRYRIIDYVESNSDFLPENIRQVVDEVFPVKNMIVVPQDLLGYLRYVLSEMESGIMKTSSSDSYNENTVRNWKNFEALVARFVWEGPSSGHRIPLSNINKPTFDRFVHYMDQKGYMVKSVNKYIRCFKALVRMAHKEGLIDNVSFLDSLRQKNERKSGSYRNKVYLTVDELQLLYDMPLSGLDEKCRDLFLVGCYTCQRISGYGHFSKEAFQMTQRGTNILKFTQEKTGNEVYVPIVSEHLRTIIDKYQGDFPKISEQVLNRHIKSICFELALKHPSLMADYTTCLTMQERKAEASGTKVFRRNENGEVVKHKWELISTHCARRSGITNLYLSGVFSSWQLMSISGHKTEKSFNEYLAMSGEEVADAIAEKARAIVDKGNKNGNKHEL